MTTIEQSGDQALRGSAIVVLSQHVDEAAERLRALVGGTGIVATNARIALQRMHDAGGR